ncbi:MAG: phytanoyl-CoA dioxygenase family protein [Proteobacteria bacterium]|nr:phytanoyl-CoA dioxygenase family protein [Pseudomonadota bacterium]
MAGREASHGLRNVLLLLPKIRGILAEAEAENTASFFASRTVSPVKSIFFDKVPGKNWFVPWHQDLTVALKSREQAGGFANWTSKAGACHAEAPLSLLQSMVTIRFHLDESGPNNGGLIVLRGSQKLGRIKRQDIRKLIGATIDRPVAFPVHCDSGDLLVMSPLLLHSSARSRNLLPRRVLHIEYAPLGDLPEPLKWAQDPRQSCGQTT